MSCLAEGFRTLSLKRLQFLSMRKRNLRVEAILNRALALRRARGEVEADSPRPRRIPLAPMTSEEANSRVSPETLSEIAQTFDDFFAQMDLKQNSKNRGRKRSQSVSACPDSSPSSSKHSKITSCMKLKKRVRKTSLTSSKNKDDENVIES